MKEYALPGFKNLTCERDLLLFLRVIHFGKGKEADPTDASANWLVDTLPMCQPTSHRHVGQYTTQSSKNLPFLTVLLFLSIGSKSNFIRKDKNVKAKQPPF